MIMSKGKAKTRDDIADTRADLGQTAQALAEKTDVRVRAKNASAQAAAQVQDAAAQTAETVRRPTVWGPIGAGMLAAGTAVVWARRRRGAKTPQSRAVRAWHKVADPVS